MLSGDPCRGFARKVVIGTELIWRGLGPSHIFLLLPGAWARAQSSSTSWADAVRPPIRAAMLAAAEDCAAGAPAVLAIGLQSHPWDRVFQEEEEEGLDLGLSETCFVMELDSIREVRSS